MFNSFHFQVCAKMVKHVDLMQFQYYLIVHNSKTDVTKPAARRLTIDRHGVLGPVLAMST
jgi:hypothetical protein